MLVIVKSSQMNLMLIIRLKMTELLLSDNKMINKVHISLYNS